MEYCRINWFLENVNSKEIIFITKSPFHVGRAEHMDLVCRSVNVSRNHADILVYIDGSLHIKENKAVNGTFINKIQIQKNEIANVNEGDEIGFGAHSEMVLETGKSFYVYIARRKVIDDIKPYLNISRGQQLEMCIKPNVFVEDNKSLINLNSNCVLIPHSDVLEKPSTSSIESVQNPNTLVHTELPNDSKILDIEQNKPQYTIDSHGAVVISSDSEEVIIKKVSFADDLNGNSMCNDSMFCNIKKEIDALDKMDAIPTYYIDSDSDEENFLDILKNDEDLLESTNCKNTQSKNVNNNMVDLNVIPQVTTITNLQGTSNEIKRKTFEIPPIVSPHFEKNCERNNKRQSSDAILCNKPSKKIKTNSSDNSELKEKRITRKQKLHDVTKKTPTKQIEVKATKSHIAKVKVSEGRGKFLETPCTVASTSRINVQAPETKRKSLISVKVPVKSNNCSSGTASVKDIQSQTNKQKLNNVSSLSSKTSPSPIFYSKHSNKKINGYYNGEHATLMKDVEDIISEMLTWKVSWFNERNFSDTVPQLRKEPLQRMNKSFISYAEYYNVVMPLLLVEVWNFLYKEVDFNFVDEPIIYFTIINESVRTTFCELNCLTRFPKHKNFKEGDIIVLQLYLKNPQCASEPHKIAVLGYVTYVNKKNFIDKEGSSTASSSTQIIDVNSKVIIQRLDGELIKSGEVRPFFQYITSFISSARTIRSIKYLEKSPLCEHILRPSFNLYRLPACSKPQLYIKNELNQIQMEAVGQATSLCLSNTPNIYLLHGPPGTGKTTVIINIIFSVIFNKDFKHKCILVTAPTNAAVDELALRIISAKTQLQDDYKKMVSMVRIGPKNSIRPEVQDYSLYELAKRTLFKDLMRHDSIENRRKLQELKNKEDYWRHQTKQQDAKVRARNAVIELEECCKNILGRSYNERINEWEKTVLEGARIICTTLSSCASVRMEKVFSRLPGKISCCIVDEATQSTEQETLIPLILGVNKLILVGDPKQLPALSFAQESKTYGFGQSLFSRIDENFKGASCNPIKFLNMQYRMHPAICLFPNQEFYEGRLKNAPTLFNRKSPLNTLRPYIVFQFQGDTDNTETYRNKSEIACVMLLLEAIISKIPGNCSFNIGIVTPYNDQKDGIIEDIKKKTFRSNVVITVNTVDSFQGRENDVMIMSCVRYHANNFLSDDQRLNVALTRAKFALFIIGSANLFMSCVKFGKIKRDADRRKLLKNLDTRMPMSAIKKMIFF